VTASAIITTTDLYRPAGRITKATVGHEVSAEEVGRVLAVLDGELEDIWLDEWQMPEGIGYRVPEAARASGIPGMRPVGST
jgi:hypothetical protein